MSEDVEMKDLLLKAIRHAHDSCVNGKVARPDVHRQIFCMRLEGYTLKECAEAVKLSRERTRQIEVSYARRVQNALLLLTPDDFWAENERLKRYKKMLELRFDAEKRRQEEEDQRAKRRAEEAELEAKREAKRWADYSALENVRARKADKAYSKLSRAEKLEFHIRNNPKLKGLRDA